MSVDLKVVSIDRAPLTDIPKKLRELADAIEAGDHGDVETLFAVMPRPESYPLLFGWGHVEGQSDPIIQLELVKHWLLTHLVAR